jgi:hypothetical protein
MFTKKSKQANNTKSEIIETRDGRRKENGQGKK